MNKWTEIAKDEWKRNATAFVTLMRLRDESWMLYLPFESYYASSLQDGMDLYEKLRG